MSCPVGAARRRRDHAPRSTTSSSRAAHPWRQSNSAWIYDFRSGERSVPETRVLDVDQYAGSGHGGGDWRLVANWVEAVGKQDAALLSSTVDVSIESHVVAFAAKSRTSPTVESIRV